jgi:nucleoside-triphosphatase THEP1
LFGIPGSGKSTVIRNVTNHIAERAFYPEGILYLNVENILSMKDILRMIYGSFIDSENNIEYS